MRKLLFLLAFMLHSTALGQIVTPAEVEPYRVSTATVKASVPEGATFSGGWVASEGVSFLSHSADTIHWTAPPGEHSLSYSGFWLHVVPVTFTDGSGKEITIQSYLGHGSVNESATFTVVGGADPVPKPDPPKPAGPKKIVFFVAADNLDSMPYAQRYLVTSLVARKNLAARGHSFLLIDDDQMQNPPTEYAPWVEAVKDDPLPRVAFADADGGPITDFAMPVDYKHLLELIGETP